MRNLSAIIRLFIANSISGFAQGISLIAVSWYFVDILQNPTLWGNIYAAITFISLFWGLYAGTLVDRYNRKHIFLAENMAGALVLLSVSAIGFYLGGIPTPLAALCFAITFFIFNIHYPALYAFAQEITDQKHYSRITSYLEIQGQLTTMLSGAIGALLLSGVSSGEVQLLGTSFNQPFHIEAWSLQKVFLLDGLTYIACFLIIIPIRYTAISKRYKETGASLIQRFNIGIQYLKKHPLIFVFGNAAYFIFVTTMVINFCLFPNFVKNHLNGEAHVFAIGELWFALGAVGAGIFISTLFKRTTTVMGTIVMTLVSASTFFFLTNNRTITGFYTASFFLGLANAGDRIMRVTYLFNHIPNQVIGRTQSVFTVINVVMRLFFIVLFSLAFFVEYIGIAFFIFAICCLVAAAFLAYFYKGLVNMPTHVDAKE